jgi:hypothetical protein
MKKEWKKPQLLSITRNNADEAVLTICKVDVASAGTWLQWNACWVSWAGACSSTSAS